MELDETHAFVSVIRAGSFTAASRESGVPKSTLSKQVSRLEESLGVQLMARTTRRIRLTEAGRTYYDRCRPAVSGFEFQGADAEPSRNVEPLVYDEVKMVTRSYK